jgi:GAF domain-containing protein
LLPSSATAQELGDMLRAGLDEALAVMEMAAGGVYLLDEAGQALQLVAHRGLDGSPVAAAEPIRLGRRVRGARRRQRRRHCWYPT